MAVDKPSLLLLVVLGLLGFWGLAQGLIAPAMSGGGGATPLW
jgi:hypothetical protein